MPRHCSHDYRAPAVYYITLGKRRGLPDFSRIAGKSEYFVVERSAIGHIIEQQLVLLPELCPALKLVDYIIMPDHIHLLIHVRQTLPEPLDTYIGRLKANAGREAQTVNIALGSLFEDDFHDLILSGCHSVKDLCRYMQSAPRRALLRRERTDFYSRCYRVLSFEGVEYHALGNLHLLANPFRRQVIVHRSDTHQHFLDNRRQWLYTAANGGVLVSPFISPHEQNIRTEAEAVNGKIILLTNRAFTDMTDPTDGERKHCRMDRLLIIAPAATLEASRNTWLQLNRLAGFIASPAFKI